MKHSITLVLLLAGIAGKSFCQQDSCTVEITKSDILFNPKIKSDKICVLGVRLGMSKEEVVKLLNENTRIRYTEENATDKYSLFVYDKITDKQLLSFKWHASDALNIIIFSRDFGTWLIGNTPNLLTLKSLAILGDPDKKKVTIDVSALKSTTHYYSARGIKIVLVETAEGKSVVTMFYKTD